MKKKPILSFTSTSKRIPLIDNIFKAHVELAEACGMTVCFACQDDSVEVMTPYQKELVVSGKVELLHVPVDHGSNTKWTLCRAAHPNAVMVVVDDDWIYDAEGIKSLLETHRRYPEAVICRAYRTIPWIGDSLPEYKVKPFYTYPKTVTAHIAVNRLKDNVLDKEFIIPMGTAFPEHFLGVLYPPGFPSQIATMIPEEGRKDDDVVLGGLVAIEGRQLVFAGRRRISWDKDMNLPNSLWENCRASNGMRTYKALKAYEHNIKEAYGKSGLGRVFLLTCRKYPKRRESMKKELSRLGISFTEQYDDGSFLPSIGAAHKHLNRCHLAKYLALSTFLKEPEDRITIIEDDIRFLRDLSLVSRAIETIPDDFGVCRMSWSPSPYIRSEMENTNPLEVAKTEESLAQDGAFWTKCSYASTDGCTIISRKVAEAFYDRLDKMISADDSRSIDNSDDLLCRVCNDLELPMYVYKPLPCIQVIAKDVEPGKSTVDKFLSSSMYRVPGIIHHIDEYAIDVNMADNRMNSIGRRLMVPANNGYCLGRSRIYYGNATIGQTVSKKKGWW